MSHHESIALNKKSFAVTGQQYDSKDSVQTLTDLFVHSLLTFDVAAPRKLAAETEDALDQEDVAKLMEKLDSPERLRRKLVSPECSIVDFACGTGLVMEKIAPYISKGKFTGIDISEAMLAQYDAKAEKLKTQFPDLAVRSLCGDIMDPAFDTSSLEKSADILICTLAFHHLHQYDKVTQKLKTFVKSGGWILIYDFYNEDNELPVAPELAARGVSRHGLSVEEMSACLRQGCSNVSSVREFKAKVWQEKAFVLSHCSLRITDNLDSYPCKDDCYYVGCSIILGVAQVD